MCMGGGPSYPAPPPPPAAPSADAAEALTRAQQERAKSIAAAGLGSTILTGGLGSSDYDTTGKRGTAVLGRSNVT
jgi:hypothetical protein